MRIKEFKNFFFIFRPPGAAHFSNLYQKHKTLLTIVCIVNNVIKARLHLQDFCLVFLYSIQSWCFTLTRTQTRTSPLHSLALCTCTITHNPSWKERTQLLLPTHSLTNTPVFSIYRQKRARLQVHKTATSKRNPFAFGRIRYILLMI